MNDRSPKPPRHEFPLFGGRRVKPSPEGMKKLLKHFGVELELATLEQLWQFHTLLRERNSDQDLTRLNAFETMVARHYADCILINAYVESWPRRMIDIGSGAGFPGIPLKLVNPEIELTLCEPRPNRVNFLNLAIRELGLKDIDVFGHKVTSNSMKLQVGGAISRAFELIEKTLPRLGNSLEVGGKAFFMKGPAVKEELKNLKPEELGYRLEAAHYYKIPNTEERRALVILERIR